MILPGTQVAKSATATNAIVIVYTVPSGKTLYLNSCSLNFLASAATVFYLGVRDTADVDQYYIITLTGAVATADTGHSMTFPIPLEIPAGWDIFVRSTTASGTAYGFIHGFEM